MPIFPVFLTVKRVVVEKNDNGPDWVIVEEEMMKRVLGATAPALVVVAFALIEKSAKGEEVPTPTFPVASTRKVVAVEEPMAKGTAPAPAWTESDAHGEVEPTPTFEAKVLATVVEVATR